ncbi:MAG TPA: hypothetical protein VFL85_03210 [Candidatus Saccharimonadales bacterium]|nr:hypothetical protein [Candidatus Saccharimonadales bacterium]
MSKANTSYLEQLIELMQRNAERQDKRMDALEAKIDANSKITGQVLEQAKYTNGRVTKAEKNLVALENKVGDRVPLLNSKILYLVALGFVILLLILAQTLHVGVDGVL